jgi:hypothetical protein
MQLMQAAVSRVISHDNNQAYFNSQSSIGVSLAVRAKNMSEGDTAWAEVMRESVKERSRVRNKTVSMVGEEGKARAEASSSRHGHHRSQTKKAGVSFSSKAHLRNTVKSFLQISLLISRYWVQQQPAKRKHLWTTRGSNPRPSACKADALPLRQTPLKYGYEVTVTVLEYCILSRRTPYYTLTALEVS